MRTSMTSDDASLGNQYLNHLIAYLKLSGWTVHEHPKWLEFYGNTDTAGNQLLLVLPRDPNATDLQSYVQKTMDLLSAVADEPLSTTIQRVQYYHSDVIIVRNLETGVFSSISLRLADTQVSELKSLVAYGARTEREPRPYYQSYSTIGTKIIEQFRFGHTVRQSFGLTMEAPIIHDMELFTADKQKEQPPLLSDLAQFVVETEIAVPPLERRIVERIIRGLNITWRATEENSLRPLLEEYGSGFNGNMCISISKIADHKLPIEYRVLWSPKLPVPSDLSDAKPVRLNQTSYILLKQASQELRNLEPEVVRVRGIITHVGSHVPPLSEDNIGRQVVIRWQRPSSQRTQNVVVPLSKDQYVLAHRAHLQWATVEVTGAIIKTGSTYRLVDARDLEIFNPGPFI